MFQHKGTLKGYAHIMRDVRLSEPVEVGGSSYSGYFEFYPENLGVYEVPLTIDDVTWVDSNIKHFSQVKQTLSLGTLPYFMDPDTLLFAIEDHPEDVTEDVPKMPEGASKRVTVNAYERNPQARAACIRHYREADGRIKCQICGFEFGERYGPRFIGTIHIHHLVEISSIGKEYQVDPIKDLIPVCPNCHTAIHKRRPAFTPEEMKEFLSS